MIVYELSPLPARVIDGLSTLEFCKLPRDDLVYVGRKSKAQMGGPHFYMLDISGKSVDAGFPGYDSIGT